MSTAGKPWNTPKSVAVESCGFWAAAPVWRRRGATWILLTSEQIGYLVAFFPEALRWRLSGDARTRELSGYPPHRWLGYSDDGFDEQRDRMPVCTTRGDLIVDAGRLLALMESVEARFPCYVVNGTRTVTALLQAACGKPTTGRAVAVHACEACDGRGSTGDYARGTGQQCAACGGCGELRDAAPTSETEVRP